MRGAIRQAEEIGDARNILEEEETRSEADCCHHVEALPKNYGV
jgi:hypothetical protein